MSDKDTYYEKARALTVEAAAQSKSDAERRLLGAVEQAISMVHSLSLENSELRVRMGEMQAEFEALKAESQRLTASGK